MDLCREPFKRHHYFGDLSHDWDVSSTRRMSLVGDSLAHVALAGGSILLNRYLPNGRLVIVHYFGSPWHRKVKEILWEYAELSIAIILSGGLTCQS